MDKKVAEILEIDAQKREEEKRLAKERGKVNNISL